MLITFKCVLLMVNAIIGYKNMMIHANEEPLAELVHES